MVNINTGYVKKNKYMFEHIRMGIAHHGVVGGGVISSISKHFTSSSIVNQMGGELIQPMYVHV